MDMNAFPSCSVQWIGCSVWSVLFKQFASYSADLTQFSHAQPMPQCLTQSWREEHDSTDIKIRSWLPRYALSETLNKSAYEGCDCY